MRYFIVIGCIITALTGCATSQPEVFKLENGETVICHRYAQKPCGMNLMECGDQKELEFDCLTHVYYDRPSSTGKPAAKEEKSK